jgi:hypothetical protein
VIIKDGRSIVGAKLSEALGRIPVDGVHRSEYGDSMSMPV